MKKLKKHNELEVGKYYQLYDQSTLKNHQSVTDMTIEVSYWKHIPSISKNIGAFGECYYYHEITAHSYNRIKRNVMRRLGLVENSNG